MEDLVRARRCGGCETLNNTVVSVISIFLNEERFLQDAIDSVRAQTSGDWELLLVDGGSTEVLRCARLGRRIRLTG